MDNLNFKHLFYFYIIAKEGSIKQAAEKLHVSQPTLSDQLKLLESFLNCKLFDRKNRGLSLTHEGTSTLEYAIRIFELSTEMTNALRHNFKLPKKSLDIGITHHMSQHFLYENLNPLFNQTEVSINVTENERSYLLADLEEGKIDMLFTDNKAGLLKTMDAHRIGVNKTFVLAHKKFKKFKKTFPESLSSIPFFNYTKNSFLKYEIELFFAKNKIQPITIGEGDDINLLQVVLNNARAFVVAPEVAKNQLCLNKDIISLGTINDLETSVWGVIKNDYTGIGYNLLRNK